MYLSVLILNFQYLEHCFLICLLVLPFIAISKCLKPKQRSKIRSNLYWLPNPRLSICIQLSLYLLKWKYDQQLNIRLQCCSSDVSIRNHFNFNQNMLYKWSLLSLLCIHYLSDMRVSLNYADCNEELNWLTDVDYFNSNLNGLIITHNYYESEYFRVFKNIFWGPNFNSTASYFKTIYDFYWTFN